MAAVGLRHATPASRVDARVMTAKEVLDYIVTVLPREFVGVSCVFQWSASAKLKSDEVRVRVWFRPSRPVVEGGA